MNRDELRKEVDRLKSESMQAHQAFIELTQPGFLTVTVTDDEKSAQIDAATQRCDELDKQLSAALHALLRAPA